jgi:hypothetical protein
MGATGTKRVSGRNYNNHYAMSIQSPHLVFLPCFVSEVVELFSICFESEELVQEDPLGRKEPDSGEFCLHFFEHISCSWLFLLGSIGFGARDTR